VRHRGHLVQYVDASDPKHGANELPGLEYGRGLDFVRVVGAGGRECGGPSSTDRGWRDQAGRATPSKHYDDDISSKYLSKT
jgi:hypothetical protein